MPRRIPALLALVLLLSTPLAAAQTTGTRFRPEPIAGLAFEPLQEDEIELAQGATTNVSFDLRNDGNGTLQLRVNVVEPAGPDEPRHLDLRASATSLTLVPGEETRLDVEVTLHADTPNGTKRTFILLLAREGEPQMQDHRTVVRAPGECDGCPPPNGDAPMMFRGGSGPPGGEGSGGQVVFQRPADVSTAGNQTTTTSDASRHVEDPYAETPAPAAVFVALALVGAALLARRRGV